MTTDLGLMLAKAYQEFVNELHATLGARGFTDLGRSDGFVFRALADQPATVSELATRLGISKQGAGQIIEDMERRGYVRRRQDPDDARARPVELAARGQHALAAARAFHQQYERRLARQHGRAAMRDVRAVLTAMAGGEAATLDPQVRAMYF